MSTPVEIFSNAPPARGKCYISDLQKKIGRAADNGGGGGGSPQTADNLSQKNFWWILTKFLNNNE